MEIQFDKFTIYSEKMDDSIPLKSLTLAETKELVGWEISDKLLYRTPKIKLESLITSKGVNLYKSPNPHSESVNKTVIKQPYIKIHESKD